MKRAALFTGLVLVACFISPPVPPVGAQPFWPYVEPTNPVAQNNARNLVLNQITKCQNSTRASSHLNGYDLLSQQFQEVRDLYAGLQGTLTRWQLGYGGNRLAELGAGLDIIQEAFTDYKAAVGNGESANRAFRHLQQVLYQALAVWREEFKQVCHEIRVGQASKV